MLRKRMLTLGVASLAALAVLVTGTVSASARSAKATINVVHGIPGLDVDVCVEGAKAIRNFNPGEVVAGVKLPPGTYHLGVVAHGTPCSAEVLAADATVTGGRNYTVVANLNASGDPNLKIFTSNVSKVDEGTVRLQLRHTAAAPAVNVWADGARLNAGNRFTWGERRVRIVPDGAYRVKVTLPDSTRPVIGPVQLHLQAGYAYQVYAWGSAGTGYDLAVVPVHVGQR